MKEGRSEREEMRKKMESKQWRNDEIRGNVEWQQWSNEENNWGMRKRKEWEIGRNEKKEGMRTMKERWEEEEWEMKRREKLRKRKEWEQWRNEERDVPEGEEKVPGDMRELLFGKHGGNLREIVWVEEEKRGRRRWVQGDKGIGWGVRWEEE